MTEPLEPAPSPRVVVLIATIPARRNSCERLLNELSKQSRPPDGVVLVLDGYGTLAAPASPLPVFIEARTDALTGAGSRWRAALDLPAEDIVICLDDDIMLLEAHRLVQKLVEAVEKGGGAAAVMGRASDGKAAPPGRFSRGNLIYAAGCGLTVRAKHLVALQEFSAEVQSKGGPNALGLLGDDDALVSAFLWKSGVPILHAAAGNIYAAPGMRTTSQTAARAKESPDAQKVAIKKATGWPWPVVKEAISARRA